MAQPTFYEFFAGAGMARAGLGDGWRCLFANDFDHKKGQIYRYNWGQDSGLITADICTLATKDIPGLADLAWASFPCQDLSLAGGGAGLKGNRSGTFWPFWKLMIKMMQEGRAPNVIVLENVCGTLTSHKGADFVAICDALSGADYLVGALVIDAAMFVPQSRPRLFVIGVRDEVELPKGLISDKPIQPWHTSTLVRAQKKLTKRTAESWIWWNLPLPPSRQMDLSALIEEPSSSEWFTPEKTAKLLAMMSDVNRAKIAEAQQSGRKIVGTIYKRTRLTVDGRKIQRAEVRFDGVSGCLRTPAGGSSRQIVIVVEKKTVRARLITTRETARLMGLNDNYVLPDNYNEAYHLTGDGVVVPVVRHLATNILEPILQHAGLQRTVAA